MLEQCPIVRTERGCWWFSSKAWIPSANPRADPREPFILACYPSLLLKSLCCLLLIRVLSVLICMAICTSSSRVNHSQDVAWILEINIKGPETLNILLKDVLCRGERRPFPLCSQLLRCTSFKHRVINAVSGKFFSKSSLKAWWGVCPLLCNSGRMLTFYHKAIINNEF